ncbi:hypothetical protein [Roseateles violae]|uniref:Uncharacterized protein n=1 Tax=Roseateles violae TaxID=3058042 RepID=A0ABT8DUJ6_9BURK|nr:hypothetical protein [Pelomonas sp. PFR6]MDN3920584.1 hypothetical protein [Pelomonas sp. PFR6]
MDDDDDDAGKPPAASPDPAPPDKGAERLKEQVDAAVENAREGYDRTVQTPIQQRPEAGERREDGESDPTGTRRR